MSQTDFKTSANVVISISIVASGEFDPTMQGAGNKLTWSLNGTARGASFDDTRTTKEKTCGVPFGIQKTYADFSVDGSVGSTSGTINIGRLPRFSSAETVGGYQIGTWKVNTSPVLSSSGFANGIETTGGYYIVELPQDAKADDPIVINPPIDYVSRVYPGDKVYSTGATGNKKWNVLSQERFPLSDRTFFWEPNENPKLEAGGIADGKLAKPGTVMLPTSDHYIPVMSDGFDGMRYFYQNQGVMFDGQKWTKLLLDPYAYKTPSNAYEFRNLDVYYFDREFHPQLLEFLHSSKCFGTTNQEVDDSQPITYSQTFENETTETDFLFRWGDFNNKQIQGGRAIKDFGDAWSKYHLANLDWLVDRKIIGTYAVAFAKDEVMDPDGNFYRPAIPFYAIFKDGYTTEIKEQIEVDGETLTNEFSITVNVAVSQQ